MKTCTKCKVKKPLDCFSANTTRRVGVQPKCKACNAAYREENRCRIREGKKLWRLSHPEVEHQRVSAWQKNNKTRVASRNAKWKKANPASVAANGRRRQCVKVNATPAWANDFFIKEIYALAALRTQITKRKWHVDHIVPLRSKLVCGLHVEHNLQVIPAKDNMSKGNHHWPDMPRSLR